MILLKVVFIEKYPYTKLVVNFNNKQRHLKNVFQCSHCTTKKMEHELDDSESGLAQILSLSLFFFFFINLFAHKKLRSCQWRNSMKQYMNYKVFLRSGSRLNFEVLNFRRGNVKTGVVEFLVGSLQHLYGICRAFEPHWWEASALTATSTLLPKAAGVLRGIDWSWKGCCGHAWPWVTLLSLLSHECKGRYKGSTKEKYSRLIF